MRKLMLIELSPAARAAIAAGALAVLIASAVVGDYLVANWRASQAVQHSQHILCQVIQLVTAHPVPKPSDPAANPSREQSYRFYSAFTTVGHQYHC